MHTLHFAYRASCAGAGVHRGTHRPYISGYKNRAQTAADLVPANELHAGSFQHCICSLDHCDQAFRLDHSNRFIRHLLSPIPIYFNMLSTSASWGRAITCDETSSPTALADAAPASTAARTLPTSPRTIAVTYPPPICP